MDEITSITVPIVTATVFLIVMMICVLIYIEQYKCIVRCVHVYYDQDIVSEFPSSLKF
jgi:hypothetical protein